MQSAFEAVVAAIGYENWYTWKNGPRHIFKLGFKTNRPQVRTADGWRDSLDFHRIQDFIDAYTAGRLTPVSAPVQVTRVGHYICVQQEGVCVQLNFEDAREVVTRLTECLVGVGKESIV